MIDETNNTEILSPKKQTKLYGYKNYFNLFVKLFEKNKLPNVVLLNGNIGLGKATFVYHFANYILSQNENKSNIGRFFFHL